MIEELKKCPLGEAKYIVFYHDGYYNNGDLGIRLFSHIKDAEEFIVKRMERKRLESEPATISSYEVFFGGRQKIQEVDVVKEIKIESVIFSHYTKARPCSL